MHRVGQHRRGHHHGGAARNFGQNVGKRVVSAVVGDKVDGDVEHMALKQRAHNLGGLRTVEIRQRQQHGAAAQTAYITHGQGRKVDYDVAFEGAAAVGDMCAGAGVGLVGVVNAGCGALLNNHRETAVGKRLHGLGGEREAVFATGVAFGQPEGHAAASREGTLRLWYRGCTRHAVRVNCHSDNVRLRGRLDLLYGVKEKLTRFGDFGL